AWGDVQAVPLLIECLHDEDVWVRKQAASSLGALGDVRAVEPLIECLSDGELRRPAAESLGKLGDARAVQPLLAYLPTFQRQGISDDAETEKSLPSYGGDLDLWIHVAVARSLAQLGEAQGVVALIALLHQQNEWVRRDAAASLGTYRATQAVEPLIARLQ